MYRITLPISLSRAKVRFCFSLCCSLLAWIDLEDARITKSCLLPVWPLRFLPQLLEHGSSGDWGFHFSVLFAAGTEYLLLSFSNGNGQPLRWLLPQQPLLDVESSDSWGLTVRIFLIPDGILRLPLQG